MQAAEAAFSILYQSWYIHCAAHCRYSKEWQKTVERIGRWIDFDNGYKTLDPSFMESVWWVFSTLHKKGLVYQGFKVTRSNPYCAKACSACCSVILPPARLVVSKSIHIWQAVLTAHPGACSTEQETVSCGFSVVHLSARRCSLLRHIEQRHQGQHSCLGCVASGDGASVLYDKGGHHLAMGAV